MLVKTKIWCTLSDPVKANKNSKVYDDSPISKIFIIKSLIRNSHGG